MATRTCSEPGCGKPHLAGGLCAGHYSRKQRRGDAKAPYKARPFTPREDEHLLALKTSPGGRVCNGQLPELAVMFGRSVAVLKQRRRYLLGRVKPHPGPHARRRAAAERDSGLPG